MPERLRSRSNAEARLFLPLLILCGVTFVLAAAGPVSGLLLRVSSDYGEGWNAYWAAAAMGTEPLYSKNHLLVANNYPPLSFYLIGGLGRLIGDNIFAGRIVAIVAQLAVAGLIAIIVRRLGGARRWAIGSALLFLAYDVLCFWPYIAINNPQWLAQAVMLAGVLPLIAGTGSLSRRRVILAAAIMVCAGLIKHNQLALPLAVTAWLFMRDRNAFTAWIVAAIGWTTLACAILFAAYGPAIFIEILGFQRTTDIKGFLSGLHHAACLGALALVVLMSFRWCRDDRRWSLFVFYAVLGLVLGVLQRLASGVYINAMFDALIAFVILAGSALGRAAERTDGWSQRGRTVGLLLLMVPLALNAKPQIRRSLQEMRERPTAVATWQAMIGDAHTARGPVLCEVPAVCFWAGKSFALDFFAYGQKLRTGTDPAPLFRLLDARGADVLIVDAGFSAHTGQSRLPPPFPSLISARYRLVRRAPHDIEELVPATDPGRRQ